ncbi:ABC transporter ATP-binding protein [Thermodesulfatator autotrophicus]|uniref:High-affinity branched-chain amino acid ABC transporter ATP-binding protein LivG n=1 Tax=Thermodesulfatator autotrophicus TaxID=1795632 RepID=A0A177E4Z4_9BACT|nr:ABC transporter ATP-binding protein [Thermodesulfatator autotrophicus]OAG26786.1 high-affinity branched-chain amino acid ABC transporter ATP-binding protein LivG [Thermodesulfatator autotrophicus]
MSEILKVKNLVKTFGGLTAVKDLSFTVKKGLITALIGPNGSGKTTTFNMISGHLKPTSGEIYFENTRIDTLPPYKIARLGVARTFQNLEIFGHLTVLENVLLAVNSRLKVFLWESVIRSPSFFKKEKEAREKALEYLRLFNLEDWAEKPAASLPFGLQRYLEIARALATCPHLLLLDEAASGLDAREKDLLKERIEAFKKEGVTILLVEHDMNLVMELADEVIVLDMGRKIAQGTPREIQRHPEVIAVYLGEG